MYQDIPTPEAISNLFGLMPLPSFQPSSLPHHPLYSYKHLPKMFLKTFSSCSTCCFNWNWISSKEVDGSGQWDTEMNACKAFQSNAVQNCDFEADVTGEWLFPLSSDLKTHWPWFTEPIVAKNQRFTSYSHGKQGIILANYITRPENTMDKCDFKMSWNLSRIAKHSLLRYCAEETLDRNHESVNMSPFQRLVPGKQTCQHL